MSATLITVKKLKERLSEFPDDRLVVVEAGVEGLENQRIEGIFDGPNIFTMKVNEARTGFNPEEIAGDMYDDEDPWEREVVVLSSNTKYWILEDIKNGEYFSGENNES